MDGLLLSRGLFYRLKLAKVNIVLIRHLVYQDFRNYHELKLALPGGRVVLLGENAQGKTNFLEGIYLLATARSPRAEAERELISWAADPPLARLEAQVLKRSGSLRLEIVLHTGEGGVAHKRIRVNGLPRRAQDLPGEVLAVWFSPQDIDLVGGAPALRRRSLDLLLSQVDATYRRSLLHYSRVLVQRNHLLRLLAEGRAAEAQLEFWDGELVAAGAYITAQRRQAVAALAPLVAGICGDLAGGKLELQYLPSLASGVAPEDIAPAFRRALEASRPRELGAGMTLCGPHRDDLRFRGESGDVGVYGSRGEQRTVALALRLAEVRFLQEKAGEPPVLLLDDALSELDRERRRQLQQACLSLEQVFLTATDLDRLEPAFREGAALFRIQSGRLAEE